MDAPTGLLLYLLADTSGSTGRRSVNAGWNQAIPRLVQAVEEAAGPDARLCVLNYDDEARLLIALQPVSDLMTLPTARPRGLSGLAGGLRLLARTIDEDCLQLESDGVTFRPPAALLIADGLPTDDESDLLAAKEALGSRRHRVTVHIAVPPEVDRLAVAALAETRHVLSVGTPQRVSDSLVAAVKACVADALARIPASI